MLSTPPSAERSIAVTPEPTACGSFGSVSAPSVGSPTQGVGPTVTECLQNSCGQAFGAPRQLSNSLPYTSRVLDGSLKLTMT